LLTLIFVFGFVRWRTAQLKSRQVELETEIRNATHEIIQQKEKIELAHRETQQQKEIIEETHREITDSINYAERIQRSFLASKDLLDNYLNEYFVYFNPKEAVSGDFYWAGELPNGNFGLCCADSTGHGVPGAIMSILNISSIEKAVEKGLYNPADIFNLTRQLIIERLKRMEV
jgi:serine phosphatase RsbU (regulator of sigma subunit)